MSAETEIQPLPADQVEIIEAMQSKFTQDDPLFTEIETVIREHLRGNLTPDTYGQLWNSLELYLGEDLTSYLTYLLRLSNDPSYMAQVKAHCSEQFWGKLRRLIALHADDLRSAYRIYNENPHAWAEVTNRHTYFDYLTNTWTIAFEIVKYNGERLRIEETPGGSLALIRSLLHMLMRVPIEDAPNLINTEYLKDSFDQFAQLVNLYSPELLAELSQSEEAAA